MMFKTTVFVALVTTSYGAVSFQPYIEKPVEFADQEGCYISELKRVIPYDEPYRPANGNPCAMYVCRNNETQIDTCGNSNAIVPEGCRLILPPAVEMTAENCCGVVKCDGGNGNQPL